MRSNDQTYISSLGFNDVDKKDGVHDIACKYLVSDNIAPKIVSIIYKNTPYKVTKRFKEIKSIATEYKDLLISIKMKEKDGRFDYNNSWRDDFLKKQLVIEKNFNDLCEEDKKIALDVVYDRFVPYSTNIEFPLNQVNGSFCRTVGFIDALIEIHHSHSIYIEVKIQKESINNIVRQISFYKTYINSSNPHFFLAHRFKISDRDKIILNESGIKCLYLGDSFTKWMKEQENQQITEDSDGI